MPTTAECALVVFGQTLRAGRLKAKLTQEELAARTGIGQTTLSTYERGESEPTLSTAITLAAATGVDLEHLAAPFRATRRRPLAQVAS